MSDEPRSNGPLLVAVALIAVAVLIPSLGKGIGHGSILGAIVALAATIPAGYALWQGTQKKTQHTTLYGLLLLLLGLGVAGLLIVLKFVSWLR
jgi:hypothetical protein